MEYTVKWEIQVEATSPESAARYHLCQAYPACP